MPIVGIGVDICHVPRIARLATRERFAQRILSPAEARLFGGLPDGTRERFLAVRYVFLVRSYARTHLHRKKLHILNWILQMGSERICIQGFISSRSLTVETRFVLTPFLDDERQQ